jgi:D-glycero-D-manno-heptose 1,7-bisphosphate phosphatase
MTDCITAAPLALLDRDGTINFDPGYLRDVDALELLPGAVEGLQRLSQLGYTLAIVTNQSGIARGLMTATTVAQINARLIELLAGRGVVIAAVATCPHLPDAGCDCRKPKAQLARDIARQLACSLEGAIVIGDKASDIGLAHAIGARSILISVAQGDPPCHGQDATASDLVAAAGIVASWRAPRAQKATSLARKTFG